MALQARLPSLNGRLGTIVLIVYRVLALLTAFYVIIDLPLEAVDLFRNSAAISRYGFAVQRGAQGALPVTALYPSAERAGLRVGDAVIGLGDTRLSAGATRFDLGAKLAALNSAPAKLILQDENGALRILSLQPQAQGLGLTHLFYGMPIWAFGIVQWLALALPLVILLGASFLLYKRRPHDGEAMLLAFSFLALTFSTSSGSWPFLYAHVPELVSDVSAQVGTALLCIAVAGVPDGRFPSVWGRLAVGFAAFYGLAASWLNAMPMTGPFIGLLQILPEYAAICFAVIALIARYLKSAEIERRQIKWVLVGAVVTLLATAIPILLSFFAIEAAMPPWGQQIVRLSLFVVFHVAIPIGMLVSVLAYRLFDSEAVITRSTAYAALSIAVIGVFAASESVVQAFGEKMVGSHLGSFAGALAAVFTTMMIGPMHARIKRTAERAFRKDLFRMREELPPLVGDLRETTKLKPIADVVIERVRTGVRPTSAAIVMGETGSAPGIVTQGIDTAALTAWQTQWAPLLNGALHCNKADPTFPMRVPLAADGIGLIGWLLLGPRPDGSLFGKDERKALKEIADPVARALAIAAMRDARAALHEDDNRALRTRLEEVEAALARLAAQSSKPVA